MQTFPVSEIFGPTLSGEGAHAGLRTMFVRFGYCDGLPTGHCSWCDSMHAVDPKFKSDWPLRTAKQIAIRLFATAGSCRTVTLSGGNPLLYDLEPLLDELNGWDVWVETQGSIWRAWTNDCNVTISPKPPSAGVCDEVKLEHFIQNRLGATSYDGSYKTVLKIPVDPDVLEDLDFAQRIFTEYEGLILDQYLSVVTYPTDTRDQVIERWKRVAEWLINADLHDVHSLPQLHVILWLHEKGV